MAGIISDSNKLGGVPQSAARHVAMSTCFDVWLESPKILIGFISQLTLNHTRTVTQIRHLNSVDAGIAVDTVVTPDAPTIAFNGFYVYNFADSLQDQIGGVTTGGIVVDTTQIVGASAGRMAGVQLLMTLDQQQIPFSISVRHASGQLQTNQTSAKVIAVYKNCTLASMAVPINIGTAAVTDSGNINVGYVASK